MIVAGHPFCRECLGRWQATSHLCPVCRADQRLLERNASQGAGHSSEASGPDDLVEAPSLAAILGLMGQLMACERAGPAAQPPSAQYGSNGVHFSWSSQSDSSASQPQAATAGIDELQNSVHFVMARIDSLEQRPLYWNAQNSELQAALRQLDACQRGTVRNPAQVMQQVQLYTDTVNAQLDEFLTQSEAREQQRQAAERRHQAQSAQPSAPPFASAPPAAGTGTSSSIAPTNASSGADNAPRSGSWTWKWGWGPAPSAIGPEEDQAASSGQAQQTSGIGFGAAAAAAAALASVGTAAAAAYRRATASSRQDTSAAGAGTGAEGASAHHQVPAEPPSSLQQQSSSAAAGSPTGGSQPSGLPVQGVYNAVRGIFDQHVSADSGLGRWGEVARHLTDLHGQMNADDPQRQDVGRLLASAVNAYSAYRRATASSGNP